MTVDRQHLTDLQIKYKKQTEALGDGGLYRINMDEITLQAPAKINLGLDITGKRPDGYHTVDMINISVSLCDTVTVRKNTGLGIRIFCDTPGIPCDESNLCAKAANALAKAAGNGGFDADITIIKRIPSKAGLGGGSSDAAAAMKALVKLFDINISEADLMNAGLSVGADVPYCLAGGVMRAQGIGELLTPIDCLTEFGINILMPKSGGVSTPEAYRAVDSVNDPRRPDIEALIKALKNGDFDAVRDNTGNVFQEALPSPETARAVGILREAGCFTACLSGSGAAVFGLTAPGIEVNKKLIVQLAGDDYTVFTGLTAF